MGDAGAIVQGLHSNMVRFIKRNITTGCVFVFKVYIPIWLDLLSERFRKSSGFQISFTFQYG